MKKYNLYSIVLVILLFIWVLGDITRFLYAMPLSHNAYPILPFNVYPCYIRGANRDCNIMEGIFEMREYSEDCENISRRVERSSELDSMCFYSLLQYTWKNDSLMMQMSLKDGSKCWLLASPASSSEYKCALRKLDTSEINNTFFTVDLETSTLRDFFRKFDVHVALLAAYLYYAMHAILTIAIVVLAIRSIVLLKKYYYKITLGKGVAQKIAYLLIPFLPFITWVGLKIMTYVMVM